jgi:hypothetical protein
VKPKKTKFTQVLLAAGVSAGGVLMLHGSLDISDTGTYRLGLLLVVLSSTALVALRCHATAALLERARQDGYDDGYLDGCEISRPSRVVALGSSCNSSRSPLAGATHQLGKQRNLRRGAKRVG